MTALDVPSGANQQRKRYPFEKLYLLSYLLDVDMQPSNVLAQLRCASLDAGDTIRHIFKTTVDALTWLSCHPSYRISVDVGSLAVYSFEEFNL